MPVCAWISSKRRESMLNSRRMSRVHRSPTTLNERAIGQTVSQTSSQLIRALRYPLVDPFNQFRSRNLHRELRQQLVRRQNGVSEHGRVGFRRDHSRMAERRGRVFYKRHMIAELHAKPGRGLNATVRDQSNKDDVLNAMLLELQIEIGIRKAALRPVFLDDHIAFLRTEFSIEFAAPRANFERLGRKACLLEHVDVLPIIEVARMRTMMRNDKHLYPRRTHRGDDLAEIVEHM